MAEWLKATDCKSVRVMRTKVRILLSPPLLSGCSSMVEPQPSKLAAWVRFPSPAPNFCKVPPYLNKEVVFFVFIILVSLKR